MNKKVHTHYLKPKNMEFNWKLNLIPKIKKIRTIHHTLK